MFPKGFAICSFELFNQFKLENNLQFIICFISFHHFEQIKLLVYFYLCLPSMMSISDSSTFFGSHRYLCTTHTLVKIAAGGWSRAVGTSRCSTLIRPSAV